MRATDEDGEEIYISIDLTREQMTDLIKDRIDDSIALCRKIITANGYKNDDISKIVPIGGPSKMPIIRDMLEAGLAIEVESGLDPMTAVATGAAIFAESREWAGESSAQKSGKQREAVTGSVSLALDFKSRVASEAAKVRLKPAADMPTGHEVEILDEEGSSTGRIPIDGPLSINVKCSQERRKPFQSDCVRPTGQGRRRRVTRYRHYQSGSKCCKCPDDLHARGQDSTWLCRV